MKQRQVITFGLVSVLMCLLGVWLVDKPVAEFVQRFDGAVFGMFRQGTALIEML